MKRIDNVSSFSVDNNNNDVIMKNVNFSKNNSLYTFISREIDNINGNFTTVFNTIKSINSSSGGDS